jgi:diguanylate cyclase (GGDEF)-like protein/PAS domain S-box-containing protein
MINCLATHRVLVVTSDAADAAALGNTLEDAKDGAFVVEWASQLSDGIGRLRAGGIDAIMADLSLPDCEGLETLDLLLTAAPHTPILVLCARDGEAPVAGVLRRGAHGCLSKRHFGSSLLPQSLRNIIQRRAIEDAIFIERARAEITLNSISDAVIGTDLSGNIDYLNLAAEHLTGWTRDEARGHAIAEVMPLKSADRGLPVRHPVEWVLQVGKPMAMASETVLIRRDNSEIPVEDSAAPIYDANGRIRGAVIVFHDVMASREMTAKMAHLAQHDFLTNLPNRVLLNDRIAQGIALAERLGTHLAVLFVDLDDFKQINDSLGHSIGDKLLQSVARRLSACVRRSDTVSRQGGDEFALLVSEAKGAEHAALTAERVVAALAAPHSIEGLELNVTASIGISTYPDDASDAATLIEHADTAMYQAKEKGRNNYQFFRNDMNTRAGERQLVQASLRHALAQRQFVLHYQPKVDLNTGTIAGAEALVRWAHPQWGLTPPTRFLGITEDCGLIVQIGRWVLQEACMQAKRWEDAGVSLVPVAVNISAREFAHKSFVSGVRHILSETRLDPRRLQLEIAESSLMRDVNASAAVLMELKDIGVQLAVDDFGAGYSSLSYLTEFPIDALKIDQSLIQKVTTAKGNGVVVGAIIAMGASLKHLVVAEGVENRAQLAFLKALHCDQGQGYLFSPPLAADQFAALAATGIPRLAARSVTGIPGIAA